MASTRYAMVERSLFSRRTVSVLVTSLLIVSACSTAVPASGSIAPGSGSSGFVKKDPLKIGYSAYDLTNPYWQNYKAGIEAAAKAQGIEVIVADQKGSQQAQVSGSADLINQGISALIVSPVEPKALPATVTAAHNAQIPIIIGDVGAADGVDAFILSDNLAGGAAAADFMAATLVGLGKTGSQEIGVIDLHPGSAVGVDRVKGFKDQVAAKYPDLKIVGELNGNDAIKEGHDAAANMLTAHPNIVGIYAANDNEAQGAIAAVQEAGKDPKAIVIIGFDGNAISLQDIKAGTQAATVAQDPFGQGQLAVTTALQLLNGESVKYTDPATKTIAFPIELVDQKNIVEFMTKRVGQS